MDSNSYINKSEISEPAKIKKDISLIFRKEIKCMINITHKCKVLPLKLDCVFKQVFISTNLKGIHCYSTYSTRFSNNKTSNHPRSRIHWEESSFSTCKMAEVTTRLATEKAKWNAKAFSSLAAISTLGWIYRKNTSPVTLHALWPPWHIAEITEKQKNKIIQDIGISLKKIILPLKLAKLDFILFFSVLM